MKQVVKFFCFAVMMSVAAGTTVVAQDFHSAYFLQDYKYRHEMNPAFGNDQNYVAIPVLGSLNLKTQGNFGLGDVLFKNPESGFYNRTFMHPDVSVDEALAGFSKGKNRIAAEVGVTLLSGGFKAFGGYNTIELRSRTNVGLVLPYELFEFAKDLRNQEHHFDNIGLRAVSFAELAFGHSRQINDQWRVGAKVKVLLGVGRTNISIDGMTANTSGDKWLITSGGSAEAEVNMSKVQFVNTTDEYKGSRGGTYEHVDLGGTKIDGFGISGVGLGLDLGAEYQLMDGLKVSAAFRDLGFIGWNNSWMLKQRKGQFEFDGFHDILLANNKGTKIGDQVDDYKDQLSDFVSFDNKGDKGSSTSALAATINVGAEYQLPIYEPLSFGLLGLHRFDGDYSWSECRVSANWSPLKWLNGGMNVGFNNFAASLGWVLNIHPKGYNFFIGMDHILGKMSKEFIPLSSNANIVLGMNITWGGGERKESPYRKLQTNPANNQNQYDW